MSDSLEPKRPIVVKACAGLAILAGVSLLGALFHKELGLEHLRYLLLMTASTSFVLIALAGGGLQSTYGRLALLAVVLFWAGDFLGPRSFLMSASSFLLGHVVLMGACAVFRISWRRCLMACALMLPLGAGLLAWLAPHVPENERILVYVYLAVISGMVIAAVSTVEAPKPWLIRSAAILFFASDVFFAQWKFIDDFSYSAFFCYPLYYSACVLFAFSAGWCRKPAPGSP